MEQYMKDRGQVDRPGSEKVSGARDLRDWLARIDSSGELCRITAPVDANEELAAITYMATRYEDAPALLFEQIRNNTSGVRVLSNALGASRRRFALALGLDPDLDLRELIVAARHRLRLRIPPVEVEADQAPVNARVITGEAVDLTRLPAPKFWPRDGGAYIGTGTVTLTRNAESGRINVGTYRQMLHSAQRVGIYFSPGKHGWLDAEEWWRRGQPCEVVAVYGVDPVLFMVGSQALPGDVSELDVAGGLLGAPVEVTRGVATTLPIPARAEIVIEGLLNPGDVEMEGPLGEFTGYYGKPPSPQPVIQVKALHMRADPILTAALMADYPSCEIGAFYAILRSALIWNDLERIGVPGIQGVYAHPAAASGWGIVTISLQQQYPGHVPQVLALAAQCPTAAYYTKWIIAVDEDVDPTDINQVLWVLSTRCNPVDDIDLQRNTWSTWLDPSQFPPEARPYGSKALINACKPHRHLKEFPVRMAVRRSVYESVRQRWPELGLPGRVPRLVLFDDG